MGRRGTNQLRTINLAVPADSLGYWADRLRGARRRGRGGRALRHPAARLRPPVRHPVLDRRRDRERRPRALRTAATSRSSTRSAAPTARPPRSASPSRWTTSCAAAFGAEHVASEGAHHQYRIGTDDGRRPPDPELVEEPDLPQGTWSFGEGTIHHHAFDVGTPENQAAVKDWIVGLGYTDVSDVKDRGYFFSVYLRTPGGALFELASRPPQGFTIDEPEDELGTHMCIPPHWEDRRARDRPARADRHGREGRRVNPHLAVPPVMVGPRARRARRVAVVVHGRDAGPGVHARAPRRCLIDAPDVAYVLPAARAARGTPARYFDPRDRQRAAARPRAGGCRGGDRRGARRRRAAERVVLAGFSQGACLVADAVARHAAAATRASAC